MLFSALIILLAVLISSKTFLTDIFYKVPVFNQARHVERTIFMFAFASSILAGIGFLNLQSIVEKCQKLNKNIIKKLLYFAIVLLILFELFFMQNIPLSADFVKPNDIPILDYMGKDT